MGYLLRSLAMRTHVPEETLEELGRTESEIGHAFMVATGAVDDDG